MDSRDRLIENHRRFLGFLERRVEYADVLERVDVGGTSLKEYASKNGLTAGNAAVRAHRARQALKRRVMESCGLCADHGCVDCSCRV